MKKQMITVHICSKSDSTVVSKTIDPKTKDQFDNDISEIVRQGINQIGKFYLDFDTFDSTDEQKRWAEEENS